jgi:hypothetical protein
MRGRTRGRGREVSGCLASQEYGQRPNCRHGENTMYIGIGTLVVIIILIILLT